jgi:riboflavin synthase
MFTGIVETIGTIREVRHGNRSVTIGVAPDAPGYSLDIGGSLACDGVCLTLESLRGNVLYCTAVSETLDRTTIGSLQAGGRVNLERALSLSGRLDGHFVLGHVDATGTIVSDKREGDGLVRVISVPKDMARFIAEKGSVAVDGISLTVTAAGSDSFGVSLIPFTFEKTTMPLKKAGDAVNIECDVIARYLARLVSVRPSSGGTGPTAGPRKDVAEGSSLFDKMEGLGF